MLSPKVRSTLTVVATVVAAVGGFLVTLDGIPDWIGVVVAGLGAVFAALGIVPPQVGGTQKGVVSPDVIDLPPSDSIRKA